MSQPPMLRRCGMGDGSKIHFVLVVVDFVKMIKEISYRVFIITVPTAALAWTRRTSIRLIERLNGLYTALREEGEQKCSPEINTVAFVLMDAVTSLSTLQAENESLLAEVEHWRNAHHQAALNFQQENRECNKVLAELEKVKKAMAMMWFAYGNKDGAFPHEYEIEAIKTAEEILGPWEECMPKYLRTQPEGGQAMSMTREEAVERREQK